VDKAGHDKTVSGRVSLVSKVDNDTGKHIKTSKNNVLVPALGTTLNLEECAVTKGAAAGLRLDRPLPLCVWAAAVGSGLTGWFNGMTTEFGCHNIRRRRARILALCCGGASFEDIKHRANPVL